MSHHVSHTYHTPTTVSYLIGFSLSLLLTLAAFGLAALHVYADHEAFSHEFLTKVIIVFAILQLFVQAVFFLHLSRRKEGRFNLLAFIFTLYTVGFIVVGSLWIMDHLNQNMTPMEIDAYMHKQN